MHNLLRLKPEICEAALVPGEGFGVEIPGAEGWLARLSIAGPNRLDVFYHRNYLEPVSWVEGLKVYRTGDGIYEAEFAGLIRPHRIVFQAQNGRLAWIHSVTLDKKKALEKVSEALNSTPKQLG